MKKLLVFSIILLATVTISAQTGHKPGKVLVRKTGVVRLSPPTTYLKEGLSSDEVFRLLGKPIAVFERNERGASLATYEFQRGESRVLVADFINDKLVHSRTETRPQIAQAAIF